MYKKFCELQKQQNNKVRSCKCAKQTRKYRVKIPEKMGNSGPLRTGPKPVGSDDTMTLSQQKSVVIRENRLETKDGPSIKLTKWKIRFFSNLFKGSYFFRFVKFCSTLVFIENFHQTSFTKKSQCLWDKQFCEKLDILKQIGKL